MNSTWKIISKHTFTLFNFVNIILAAMVAFTGSYKNLLFIFIAIANTLISIINELRAQRIVNQLKLLSERRPTILKNGRPTEVAPESVALGDIVILSLGDQIMFDAILTAGTIEVNEAFITGEQENITKRVGDHLTSGSFVVAGTGRARVERIGDDNFVNKLQKEASAIKTADSKLFSLMNRIVRYVGYVLIPVGILLFWARYNAEPDTTTAITSTVAALISMIPEGLILLTSSVLALATVRLGRRKVLVHDLYAIETLARVDTICLDKTGTLTTGKMTVVDYTPTQKSFLTVLKAILTSQTAENVTVSALKRKFLKMPEFRATKQIVKIDEVYLFSSERKFSGIRVGDTEYLMGAVEFITSSRSIIDTVESASAGYRTLAIVRRPWVAGSSQSLASAPSDELLGFIRLKDEIRKTAPRIINYFHDNNIDVKIISGDDLATVQKIATAVGVRNLTGVDLSTLKSKNYPKLVENYAIFTRVTPSEKKKLIAALRSAGHTVAMTGDGVNDILAMKEADASLAIGEGSDAARRSAKFVLLDSGFEAIPAIIDEGRQSINNLERSTTLFLAKSVYAAILAVAFVFIPTSYPFSPIEMTLLNFLCIGAPGVWLALEKNTSRIKDRFIYNIKHYSVPVGIAVSLAMIALSVVAAQLALSHAALTTLSFVITFAIDLTLIRLISRPLNRRRLALILAILAVAVLALLLPFSRAFFEFALPL